jgi:hypothetical protein
MMRLIKTFGFLSLLLAIGALLYSCVEEPFIEPLSTPYSSVRIANFTNNSSTETINVKIDGEVVGTLSLDQISSRFDVVSGQRNFEISDAAGNIIYNKSLSVVSYEEDLIGFSGYYSTVDTLNSFNPVVVPEGLVYVVEAPQPDTAWVNFINYVTDTPTRGAVPITYNVITIGDSAGLPDTITIADGTVQYPDKVGFAVETALDYEYTFSVPDSDSTDYVIHDMYTFESGMRYYFHISGQPRAFTLTIDKQAPLPARPK